MNITGRGSDTRAFSSCQRGVSADTTPGEPPAPEVNRTTKRSGTFS